jgi:uncharacterized protein
LIKPAGPDCNLRCNYCFYLPKSALFPPGSPALTGETETPEFAGPAETAGGPKDHPGAGAGGAEVKDSGTEVGAAHRMSPDTLETLVRSYLATPQRQYVFNWQGGEPTLMGLDFFRRAVELQRRHAPAGAHVVNTLQTNATLIDAEWARFLAEKSFLTGVSLDGPQDIHDAYRLDVAGRGSFDRVMAGIEQLRSSGAEFNILTMVTSRSAGEVERLWSFFRQEGFAYQQYIPCVEFDEEGEPLPYTVGPEEWGRFLTEIFRLWYPEYVRTVSVRNFDTVVNFLAAGEYHSCTMRGACDQYFVVEHEGGVYPCDFFVEPQYRLGSIREDGWKSLQSSPVYRGFAAQKSRWNRACSRCEYLDYCSGDCLKMRFRGSGKRNPESLSYLCSGYREFFAATLPRFTELARDARQRVLGLNGDTVLPPVKREADGPCFCGSGKHYQNCHMRPFPESSGEGAETSVLEERGE